MCKGSKTIITFHGDVETTSFFMIQIEKQLVKDGYDVRPFYFDAENKGQSEVETASLADSLSDVGKQTQVKFLTFNFAGLYGDDAWYMPRRKAQDKELVVDYFQWTCINMIVDHPYHYHAFMQEQLAKRAERYYQICIDKKHMEYMHQYFPEVKLGPFLPSGGTGIGEISSFSDRPIAVAFTGTYMRPECFDVFINRNGKEYADFYHSMLDEAYDNPGRLLEEVVSERLREEIKDATQEEIKETLGHIQFLDYYIRFKRRGAVIRSLVDAGIEVHVIGSGWDTLECEHPENLVITQYLTSEECLLRLAQAKLSLNILPCFHEGGHDRIFNSMLCKAVCVTDSNDYLDTILRDGENAIVYSHDNLQGLAERVKQLLSDFDEGREKRTYLAGIAENGYESAQANHTWASRARILEHFLEEI